MGKRSVTIITTVYNIEKYLDRFFKSVREQSYTDYQLMIVDDGSEDNSLAVCKKYAEQDSRIRIYALKHIGISAARNFAMQKIDTEFTAYLDGDDTFEKDYLKHLVDTQRRYDADLTISNVIYESEEGEELRRFAPCEQAVYTKEAFGSLLPELLDQARLNFLYGKLFRSSILKDILVSDDVMMGSDTMINIQYVLKINSIALCEAYDYHYIRYQSRSVTSYNGPQKFWRHCRINRFVYDTLQKGGLLTDEAIRVYDKRILLSGYTTLKGIAGEKMPFEKKLQTARSVLSTDEYRESYHRYTLSGDIKDIEDCLIAEGEEEAFLKDREKRIRNKQRKRARARIKERCPAFAIRLWEKIRR